jgi:site-specific DNA-methyltransferase (adenine-specific)
MKKEELKGLLRAIFEDKIPTTVINEDKPTRNKEHPTMKPIKLMARLIQNSSRKNEKVLDLFGGSGSTLIACEQLDRVCYMMELDPAYCDVIIDRWEKLTGNKAEKIE